MTTKLEKFQIAYGWSGDPMRNFKVGKEGKLEFSYEPFLWKQLPEIGQSYEQKGVGLATTFKGKMGRPSHPHPPLIEGDVYKVYFNLNAMASGLYGLMQTDDMNEEFLELISWFRGDENAARIAFNRRWSGAIYSLKKGGKVVGHRRSGHLRNAVFEIYNAPLSSIRAKKGKTPCCYMTGEWQGSLTIGNRENIANEYTEHLADPYQNPIKDGMLRLDQETDWDQHPKDYPPIDRKLRNEPWHPVSFNPFSNDTFQYFDYKTNTFKDLYTGKNVIFLSDEEAPPLSVPYLILVQCPNEQMGLVKQSKTGITRKRSK